MSTSDKSILDHITALVDEEHRLLQSPGDPAPAQARLKDIEVQLDQCWDLLRQRRARREFGGDPDAADVRDPQTVENYRG
ncbi:MAG: DUF2630 family protein [Comamonadaceae bacterium]|nr:MAG: DUF2630 family protein [Comamonadaceae bacterium]